MTKRSSAVWRYLPVLTGARPSRGIASPIGYGADLLPSYEPLENCWRARRADGEAGQSLTAMGAL